VAEQPGVPALNTSGTSGRRWLTGSQHKRSQSAGQLIDPEHDFKIQNEPMDRHRNQLELLERSSLSTPDAIHAKLRTGWLIQLLISVDKQIRSIHHISGDVS
jgi:hypothetical protein